MAQVLTVLERLGYSVEVSEQGRTFALINGQRVCFGLEEPIRKVITLGYRTPAAYARQLLPSLGPVSLSGTPPAEGAVSRDANFV
jgi:hypothetical protein